MILCDCILYDNSTHYLEGAAHVGRLPEGLGLVAQGYVYIYIYICIYIYIYTHTYTYICIYKHVCIYMYIYVYTRTHMHTYNYHVASRLKVEAFEPEETKLYRESVDLSIYMSIYLYNMCIYIYVHI